MTILRSFVFWLALGLLLPGIALESGFATEDAKFNDPTASSFASDVAVSGTFALVGASGASGTGSVYSYQKIGNEWVFDEQFFAPDGEDSDFFGGSVAMFGDVAIIGADGDDDPTSGANSGSASLFRHDGSDWVFEQKITASDASSDRRFGGAVAISGTVAVVGFRNQIGSPGGEAYVFRYNGATWVEEKILTASDAAAGDEFGAAVSVFDDVVVVGAIKKSGGGAAYIYRNTTGPTWVEEKILTASDGVDDDEFGSSVSVSRSLAIIGATNVNGQQGAAYIYRNTGGTTWEDETKISRQNPPPPVGAAGSFGDSVAISREVALVGAWAAEGNRGTGHLFRFDGSTWVEAVIVPGDPSSNFGFGKDVALSGDYAILGAAFDSGFGNNGAAFLYNLAPVITWADPAAINSGTALSSTQLNATANLPGTFSYDPAAGAVPAAGAHTLTANFMPTDTARYAGASATVSLTVNPVPTAIANEGGSPIPFLIQTGYPLGITPPFPLSGSPDELIADRQITIFITYEDLDFTLPHSSGTSVSTHEEQFTVSYSFGETQSIEFAALPDDLVEDDQTVSVRVVGSIDWIVPNSEAGAPESNLLGGSVTGFIHSTSFDFTRSFAINSAPEGSVIPISDYLFSRPAIVGNVLTSFLDGSLELFSVVPKVFNLGVVGDLLLNGDISITDATAAPGERVIIPFEVIDERGAITQSEQIIEFSESSDDYLPGDLSEVFGVALIDVPTTGTIEIEGDRDRFEVALQPDVQYDISLEGIATGGGSLIDPEIIGVFDSLGAFVSGGADNDSGVDANSLVASLVVDVDGIYQIEVASAGDRGVGDYTLTVEGLAKEVPVLTWNDPVAIAYGTALRATQLTASANVPGTFSYAPASGKVLNAGTHILTATFTPTDTGRYGVATATVNLLVNAAQLTITADDKEREVGFPNPPLTATYAGFVNGDDVSSLDEPVALSTNANVRSADGEYPITVSGAAGANYQITFVPGILTVTKDPIGDNPWHNKGFPADVSRGDGEVNVFDLAALLAHWGSLLDPTEGNQFGVFPDVVPNLVVDLQDLIEVIVGWGPLPKLEEPQIPVVAKGSDTFAMAWEGEPAKTYDVEYSTDGENWEVIASGLSGPRVAYVDDDPVRQERKDGQYRMVEK